MVEDLTDDELDLIAVRAEASLPRPWDSFVEGPDHWGQPETIVFRTYVRRLGFYLATAIIFSAAGSTLTWLYANWSNANPIVAGPYAAIFSLSPALALVAIVEVRRTGGRLVAMTAGIAVVVFWWMFASSDSSTAALIFLWGWVVGIPTALVTIAIAGILRARNSAPTASDEPG